MYPLRRRHWMAGTTALVSFASLFLIAESLLRSNSTLALSSAGGYSEYGDDLLAVPEMDCEEACDDDDFFGDTEDPPCGCFSSGARDLSAFATSRVQAAGVDECSEYGDSIPSDPSPDVNQVDPKNFETLGVTGPNLNKVKYTRADGGDVKVVSMLDPKLFTDRSLPSITSKTVTLSDRTTKVSLEVFGNKGSLDLGTDNRYLGASLFALADSAGNVKYGWAEIVTSATHKLHGRTWTPDPAKLPLIDGTARGNGACGKWKDAEDDENTACFADHPGFSKIQDGTTVPYLLISGNKEVLRRGDVFEVERKFWTAITNIQDPRSPEIVAVIEWTSSDKITVGRTYRDTATDASLSATILTPAECKNFITEYKKARMNGNIRTATWKTN